VDASGTAGLRVAYLVSQYPAVSHTFVLREVQALRRLGAEVHTVSVRPGADGPGEEERAEEAATLCLLASPARVARAALRMLLTHPHAVLAGLRRCLRAGRPSARTRVWQLFYLAEALLLVQHCRRLRLRHVHVHFANNGADVARLAVEVGRRVPGGLASWSFTMHGPTEFYDVPGTDLAAKVAEADAVICISDFCRSQLMMLVPKPLWGKLQVIRVGLRVAELVPPPRPPEPVPGPLRVVAIGRLVESKAMSVLVQATARLRAAGIPLAVTVVGDGPQRAALTREAERLGVADAVTFVGVRSPRQVRDHLREADVLCSVSLAEGLPVVVMEAMALGLPVVATQITALPELVAEGRTGYLVPPGRPDATAAALARVAALPDRGRAMGAAGRAAVAEQHDLDSLAPRVLRVLATAAGVPLATPAPAEAG